MKERTWTISYKKWAIIICPITLQSTITPHKGFEVVVEDLESAWNKLIEGNKDVWVWVSDMNRAVRFVLSRHIYIKAAGGIVKNANGESLLIMRNGNWDLPKGKIEREETPEVAAVREVEEETGIGGLKIDRLLLESFHVYDMYGGWHIKRTYWFTMSTNEGFGGKPQVEEGITECHWCNKQERKKRLNQSFSMMKLIESNLEKIEQ